MKTIKQYFYGLLGFVAILFICYQLHLYTLKKSTQQDIDFIHQTILENHPGPYNDQDPEFVNNMNVAYLLAKKSIAATWLSNNYQNILKDYFASFHDVHIKVGFFPKGQQVASVNTTDAKHFMIKEMQDDILLVTLPTFDLNKQQQEELEDIIAQMPNYRKSNRIVFDVRGNTGGGSQWGTKIIKSLFGQEYVSQQLYNMNKNVEIYWRASKDNIVHLSNLIHSIKAQFGADSSQVSQLKTIAQGIEQAYFQQKNFYVECAKLQSVPKIKESNPVTAKIIIIINARCMSACLDFIDTIKAADQKALLIGQTTSADSVYMEIRVCDLPSGRGQFSIPIKMYRNRPRGHNVPYVPNIAYPQNINSPEEKDTWLIETICTL